MNRALIAPALALIFVFSAALPQPKPGLNLFQNAGREGPMPKMPSTVVDRIFPKSGRHMRTATTLEAIADAIKACPRTIEFDGSKDSEKPDGPLAEARLCYGPPINVKWAASSGSPRLIHEGYVQFSLPRELWLPDEFRSQWANEVMAALSEMSGDMPALEYRYKFHVGRKGIRVTEILVRTAHQNEWREAPVREKSCSPLGCAPVCWHAATQSSRTSSHLQKSLKGTSPL